jgi:hypothetical protein
LLGLRRYWLRVILHFVRYSASLPLALPAAGKFALLLIITSCPCQFRYVGNVSGLSYYHITTSPHHQSFFNAGNPKWYFTAKNRMTITEVAEIICVISIWKCRIVHT